MDTKLAVLADFASVTQDNKLNVLGIFQEVNAPAFPIQIPHMYLVVSFEAKPSEYGKQRLIRIVLSGEGDKGNEILSMEGIAEVPQPSQPDGRVYVNQVIGLAGISFEKPGTYRFVVLVENEEKAVVPLQVNEIE